MRRKATGYDNILVGLLKELGESGLKIITALVKKIYMSEDRPKDFLDVTMIALPKKNQAKKCSDTEHKHKLIDFQSPKHNIYNDREVR